jgi:hypothetical protein
MSAPHWTCEQHVAHLQLDQFRGIFDATKPADGLVLDAPVFGRAAGCKLLGLQINAESPGPAHGGLQTPSELYAHGADLVAVYNEPLGRPLRVDLLWRAIRPTSAEKFLAAVDLIVSVRTQLLESRPVVEVQSAFAATEMFRLLSAAPPDVMPLNLSAIAPQVLEASDSLGCVLWRLPGGELSYAEMIHPADFQHDEVCLESSPAGASRLCHRLFPELLEKGVILRARVRGLFLPRADDCRTAAECYAAFAAAEPPLDAY